MAGPGLTASDLAVAWKGRLSVRPLPWGYRGAWMLVAAVMVALPVVYLGMVVLVAWGLVDLVAGWVRWAGEAGDDGGSMLRVAFHGVGAVFGGVLLVFLLKPVLARSPRRVSRMSVDPGSEPLLFAFIHMVADAVGSPRPDRVEVDCRLNASAGYRRAADGRWGGGGMLVLTLGLPLVGALDLRQLAGVLAHELAHFRQGAGLRTTHFIRGVNAWLSRAAGGRDAWDEAMEAYAARGPSPAGRFLVGAVRVGVGFSRALWRGLAHLGNAVSCLLVRRMELDADRCQIEVAGSDAFEATLRRSHSLHASARGVYRGLRSRWDAVRELPENLPAALVAAEAALSEEHRERLAGREMEEREVNPFDTHPTEARRLAQSRELEAPGVFHREGPALAVFARFDEVARLATVRHFEEAFGIPRDQVRWVASGAGPGPGAGAVAGGGGGI